MQKYIKILYNSIIQNSWKSVLQLLLGIDNVVHEIEFILYNFSLNESIDFTFSYSTSSFDVSESIG